MLGLQSCTIMTRDFFLPSEAEKAALAAFYLATPPLCEHVPGA